MATGTSQKKVDGGHIKGPANCQNVIEIKAFIQLPNTKMSSLTVHGFYVTAPGNMQTIATNFFTAMSSSWGTQFGALMHTGTQFQSVQARDMTSFTNPVFIGTGTPVAGTSASPAMPPGVAAVMTENINIRGRGVKGRVFLGGWATNADAGAGLITAAVQTAINNWGSSLQNTFTTNTLTACVAQLARQDYTGITGAVHPARPMGHPAVTSYTCRDLIWDVQRRRQQL